MGAKLTGVGVGPGDPGLMTIKALAAIKECDVILLPNDSRADCYAYRIAKEAYADIDSKDIIPMDFPMTRDENVLAEAQDNVYRQVCRLLDDGKNVVFLTLGDPSVYSTYHYIHRRIVQSGREASMISGVPSFCAVAAKLGISLADRGEEIHIIPAGYDIDSAADYEGTYIYMKSGRALEKLVAALRQKIASDSRIEIYAVSNCGLPGERVMRGIDELAVCAGSGYLTTVIVKRVQVTEID